MKHIKFMGEYADKVVGKTKKTVGKLTGNRSLQAKGMAQSGRGKVQGTVDKIRGKASKRPVRSVSVKRTTVRSRY